MLLRVSRKMGAFLKKDFLIFASYRLSFLLSWISILLEVAVFYFISRLFGQGAGRYLGDYGGDYFAFVLIGLAFSGYFFTALRSFSRQLRSEQMMGTLEAIIATPTSISLVVISLSLWNFLYTSLSVFIYLLFGVLLFGLELSVVSLGGGLLILFLAVVTFSSLGIISAGFTLMFKQGDPVNWLLGISSAFLGGVYFPVKVLPDALQALSRLLPITYSLEAMRRVLLQGGTFGDISGEITVLFIFCLVFFPAGILFFGLAVKKAKKDGSLVHY